MRTIAVIGSGQAGLPLAITLKKKGYDVTLFSNRTAEQFLQGNILSSQGMFDSALQLERKWGLNFWDQQCPWNTSMTFTLSVPGTQQKGIQWKGLTKKPSQSIDQRLKFSYWLKVYERIGGKLVIQDVGITELDKIAECSELTIVAGGKGEISQLFPRDDERSTFNKPQRSLACMYVTKMLPVKDNPGVRGNIIPGIGEYFTMPGLSLNGPCEMMLFEGIPGQAFDCWYDVKSADEQLEISKKLLKQFVPWEAEKCDKIQLTDSKATLIGRYTPIVRKTITKMQCGKFILGMADTIVLNDPIAGQGANNAAKCADIYINAILEQGKEPFDEAWMQETFERYWQQAAKDATEWSTMMLSPPQPHILDLLTAAAKFPSIADKLANGFDNLSSLFPWITDPVQTKAMIEQLANEKKTTLEVGST